MQLRDRFLSVVVTLAGVLFFVNHNPIHGQTPISEIVGLEAAAVDSPTAYGHSRTHARRVINGVTYEIGSVAGSRDRLEQVPGYAVDGEPFVLSPSLFPEDFTRGHVSGIGVDESGAEPSPLFYGYWVDEAFGSHLFVYDFRNDRMFNDIRFEGVPITSLFPGVMAGSKVYGRLQRLDLAEGRPAIEVEYDSSSGTVRTRDFTTENGLPLEGAAYDAWGVNEAGDVVIGQSLPEPRLLLIRADGTVETLPAPTNGDVSFYIASAPTPSGDFAVSAFLTDGTYESFVCREELLSTGNPFVEIASGGAEAQVVSISSDGKIVLLKSGIWQEDFGFKSFSELVTNFCEGDSSGCFTEILGVSSMRDGVISGYGTYREAGLHDRGIVLTLIPRAEVRFTGGDTNNDGSTDLSDAVRIFVFLFTDGAQLTCEASADINLDDSLDISDGIALLTALFLGGEVPNSACSGTVPEDSSLTCESAPACES